MELNCKNFSKIKNINFGENNHGVNIHDVDLSSPQQVYIKEDESFYERNKTAINTLAVIGVAALAIMAGRKLLKTTNKIADKPPSPSPSNPADIRIKWGNLTDEERGKLTDFKWKLLTLKGVKNKSSRQLIEDILKTDNPHLKIEVVNEVIREEMLSVDNYDVILESITKIVPDENVQMVDIDRIFNSIFLNLFKKNPKQSVEYSSICDTIIKKISASSSDAVKIDAYDNLISMTKPSYFSPESKLNEAQFKSILGDLGKYKDTEEFATKAWKNKIYKTIKIAELKERCYEGLFVSKNFDMDYYNNFKELINKNQISDESILKIIEDINLKKDFFHNRKQKLDIYNDLLEILHKNKANSFGSRKGFTQDRVMLFEEILSETKTMAGKFYDKQKFYTYYKSLIDMIDIRPNLSNEFTGLRYKKIYSDFMDVRSELNLEKFKRGVNFGDLQSLENFINETLQYYSEFLYKSNRFKKSALYDHDYLKYSFEKFKNDMDSFFLFYVKDKDTFKEQMSEKINRFGKDKFNMNYSRSRHQNHWNSGQNFWNSWKNNWNSGQNSWNSGKNYWNSGQNSSFNSVVDKKAEAINDIVDFFKKEKVFEDEIALLQDPNLTYDQLRKIKKRFVVKYHPDKGISTEEIFKKYNGIFESLEEMLKKKS